MNHALVMEPSLHRSLDFKLIFDCLAGNTGRIKLETLEYQWPTNCPEGLPQNCIDHWRSLAPDGQLSWKMFNRGLQDAIRADTNSTKPVPSIPMKITKTQEMVKTLSECSSSHLSESLTKARKEIYNFQSGSLTSNKRVDSAKERKRSNSSENSKSKNPMMTHKQREISVLNQVEELLRNRQKGPDKSMIIDEVIEQLHSLLQIPTTSPTASNPLQLGATPYQYTGTNPYATLTRPSKSKSHGMTSSSEVPHHYKQYERMQSAPHGAAPFEPLMPEGPPPYSEILQHGGPTGPRSSVSMHNLATTNPTRQMLESWKNKQISKTGGGRPPAAARGSSKHHYYSSPNIPNEQILEEQMKQVEIYGTLTRKQRRQKKTSQDYVKQQQPPPPPTDAAQSLQIKQLKNDKDILIRNILQQQAVKDYTITNDSLLTEM